jgi:hypothetical protein
MHSAKPDHIAARATFAVLSLYAASMAVAADVPETVRGNFQLIKPVTSQLLYGALGSFSSTTGGRSTLVAIPAGVDYRLDPRWSLQAYMLLNRDSFKASSTKLEVRPVVGVTYRTKLTDVVEVGAWLRYEARFLDVRGTDSFQSRLRLRPYVDYKFGIDPGKSASWHVRGEYEPRYLLSGGPSFFNGRQLRLTLGYRFNQRWQADLRAARDWTRATPSARFAATNDSVTLQLNYAVLSPSAGSSPPELSSPE